MSQGLRENVLSMQPYSPGKPITEVRREFGLDRIIKLASNENPLGPSPKALAAIEREANELHRYPDGSAYSLKQAIVDKFSISEHQVIVGNGSDEIIHLLGLILLGNEQDEVIVGDPSFVRYDAAAQLAPCRLLKVPLDSEMVHDLSEMQKAVTDHTKIIFIANPNNPTGTIVRYQPLRSFLSDLPPHVLTVIDEAYFEFAADEEGFPDSRKLLDDGFRVAGLRTFSKAYGLAGIRLGYGFAPTDVIDAMNRAREPFNVNSLALAAGVGALSDSEHVSRTLEVTRRGISKVEEALRKFGATTYPSYANFVFGDLGRPAAPVFQALLRQGVIVRAGDAFGIPNGLRVSIGSDEEVAIFVEVYEQVMRGLA